MSAEVHFTVLGMCCVAATRLQLCTASSVFCCLSTAAPWKQCPQIALQTRWLPNINQSLLMPFWVLQVWDTTNAAQVTLPSLDGCRHWLV